MFSSIAYAHVLDQERSKLDDKSKKYVFIGYDPSSKSSKLCNLSTKKVIVSQDMDFNEEGHDWSTQEEEKCDFFLLSKKEEQANEVHEEPVIPPPSPISSSPIHESPPSPSSLEGSSSERPRKMRSLKDL